jgi:predicted nucleic-acid-binding Zn-ribbon protein
MVTLLIFFSFDTSNYNLFQAFGQDSFDHVPTVFTVSPQSNYLFLQVQTELEDRKDDLTASEYEIQIRKILNEASNSTNLDFIKGSIDTVSTYGMIAIDDLIDFSQKINDVELKKYIVIKIKEIRQDGFQIRKILNEASMSDNFDFIKMSIDTVSTYGMIAIDDLIDFSEKLFDVELKKYIVIKIKDIKKGESQQNN